MWYGSLDPSTTSDNLQSVAFTDNIPLLPHNYISVSQIYPLSLIKLSFPLIINFCTTIFNTHFYIPFLIIFLISNYDLNCNIINII